MTAATDHSVDYKSLSGLFELFMKCHRNKDLNPPLILEPFKTDL